MPVLSSVESLYLLLLFLLTWSIILIIITRLVIRYTFRRDFSMLNSVRPVILKERKNLIEFSRMHSNAAVINRFLQNTSYLIKSTGSFLLFVIRNDENMSYRLFSGTKDCAISNSLDEVSAFAGVGRLSECINKKEAVISGDLLLMPVIRNGLTVAVAGFNGKQSGYTSLDLDIADLLSDLVWEITERYQKEKRILQSESRYHSMVENLPGFVYRCLDDEYWTIKFASRNIRNITGYDYSDVLDNNKLTYQEMIVPEFRDEIRRRWDVALAEKSHFEMEYPIICADGSKKWVWERGTGVYDSEGKVMYLEGYIEDISVRKGNEEIQQKLNSELVAAKERAEESDRLKSAFLANMSHEIRTPMNGVLGFIELLKDPMLDEADRNEYLGLMHQSGYRLLDTINDIIEISKIESGQITVRKTDVNLCEMLVYFYNFFLPQAREKGLELKLINRLDENEKIIITDRYKLESIITNLMRNAIKFTREGYVEAGCYTRNGEMHIYVKDTGVGIPASCIDTIFNRFVQAESNFSRRHEGSGLGLSIVKAYAEVLGGSISVASKEGEGTEFMFKF